ncbi:MAG TPA: hypothetical protein VGZ01_00060 [Trinickia sp.]|jgi:hypothetical protein|nr:hypothetical protein [Trinickia sp.]
MSGIAGVKRAFDAFSNNPINENSGPAKKQRTESPPRQAFGNLSNMSLPSSGSAMRPRVPLPQKIAGAATTGLGLAGAVMGGPLGTAMSVGANALDAVTSHATQQANNAVTNLSQAASLNDAKNNANNMVNMDQQMTQINMDAQMRMSLISQKSKLLEMLTHEITDGAQRIAKAGTGQ